MTKDGQVSVFGAKRDALIGRPGPFGVDRRLALSALTDGWLSSLFDKAVGDSTDFCLVAVGGYGRAELAPGSDLDVLLLHNRDPAEIGAIADALWYPIWDSGIGLDHSVRTPAHACRMARGDIKVTLGLLDARVIAGSPELASAMASEVFADWRAMAPKRLADLRGLVEHRRSHHGELAGLLEPDLKEAYGGLRDASVLRAIAASWVTDVPHSGWSESVTVLLDVRDALHTVTEKLGDRLLLQEQSAVATALGRPNADEMLREVYHAARSIAFASDITWHRVDRLLNRPAPFSRRSTRRRGTDRMPLADGVVVQAGEVLLALEADPRSDPTLQLRAPASAAQAGLPLAPITIERLAAESGPLTNPWPPIARDAFISLLGSGPPLVHMWESLDQAGIIEGLIPGWRVVRSAPQRNAVHRFTVDRHLVQTAVEASALARQVNRPDLLLVGALLHDIGKARGGDHSVVGAGIAADLAPAMGFDGPDTAIIVDLVRHHLLLVETATRRDLADPATIDYIIERISDPEVLDLLHSLTVADALATGPAAWSDWRATLVSDLVYRSHARMSGRHVVAEPELTMEQQAAANSTDIYAGMETAADGFHLTVAAPDQVGLLSLVAGVLSLQRLQVRSAQVMTVGTRAVQTWVVLPNFGEPPRLESIIAELRLAIEGGHDVGGRVRQRDADYLQPSSAVRPASRVDVIEGASVRATVLEVRAHDVPGLLHHISGAIARTGTTITGAKVATIGSEAVDVFFLVDPAGRALTSRQAARVRSRVLSELAGR